MIAAWMMYSIGVTTLILLTAVLIDRAGARMGLPTRRVWLLAMVAGVALPLVAWVGGQSRPLPAPDARFDVFTPVIGAAMENATQWLWLDMGLLGLWAVASAGLVCFGLAVTLLQARRRRSWDRITLDGNAVRLSPDVGPAVVGFIRPEVVVPGWILEEPAERRRVILDHEQEHIRGGDQMLQMVTGILLASMPWNLPLWFVAHRMRDAVEVDCDRRVLAQGLDVRSYGLLLLEMGSRRSQVSWAALGFSRRTSLLEHRIVKMTARREGVTRSAGPAAGALLVIAAIWAFPQPAFGDDLWSQVKMCDWSGTTTQQDADMMQRWLTETD